MRITREISVPTDVLNEVVSSHIKLGFGIACMYVVEGDGDTGRALETILVSQDEITRLTSALKDNEFISLSGEFPAAGIYEREIFEMSGAVPLGHRDLRTLKLRSTQEGSYPLKKTPSGPARIRPNPIPRNQIKGEGLFEVPVGPIHAGVIGPGHFRFSAAGEPILMLRTYLGYTHRGIEKMLEVPAETEMTSHIERISGDNAVAHSLAYLQAMEGETEIPLRARFIRMILAEMERIYGHLGGFSGIVADTALSVPAARGYMLKERILRLNENISGHRLLFGSVCLGGVRTEIDDSKAKTIRTEMERLKVDIDELFEMLVSSASFMDRAEMTGILATRDAVALRAVGPVARGSGLDYDVRTYHPYEAYHLIEMKAAVHTGGDVYARFKVKKNEILESISIITQCLDKMENGPISCPVEIGDGFRMGMVESPRGELIHCAHIVNGKIWRYKIRDASFPNWPAIEYAVSGNIIPDFPLINKSFDLSYSGNDL